MGELDDDEKDGSHRDKKRCFKHHWQTKEYDQREEGQNATHYDVVGVRALSVLIDQQCAALLEGGITRYVLQTCELWKNVVSDERIKYDR